MSVLDLAITMPSVFSERAQIGVPIRRIIGEIKETGIVYGEKGRG